MKGVNTLPVHTQTHTHTHTHTHKHTAESPPVKRVLLAFCLTSYSAQCVCVCLCVRFCVCEGVIDPDGDGFIITGQLLFLLLFYGCFYCSLNWNEERRGDDESADERGEKKMERGEERKYKQMEK